MHLRRFLAGSFPCSGARQCIRSVFQREACLAAPVGWARPQPLGFLSECIAMIPQQNISITA